MSICCKSLCSVLKAACILSYALGLCKTMSNKGFDVFQRTETFIHSLALEEDKKTCIFISLPSEMKQYRRSVLTPSVFRFFCIFDNYFER